MNTAVSTNVINPPCIAPLLVPYGKYIIQNKTRIKKCNVLSLSYSNTIIKYKYSGRLKMREWKMRYGQKYKGGKCRSRLAVWKAEPRLYSETALSYFLKIVLRLLTE